MTMKTDRPLRGAARWMSVSFLAILVCTAISAFPSAARATAGMPYTQSWCVLGFVDNQVKYNRVNVQVETSAYCAWGDLSNVTDPSQLGPNHSPVVSRQVSVYGIAWYLDPNVNAWYQCTNGRGKEVKYSNASNALGFVDVTGCPHGVYLSVWAHVAAQQFSSTSWQGGDVYGGAIYYP
jgi:hypothetical protein